jgi:Tetratricopeptide repeat
MDQLRAKVVLLRMVAFSFCAVSHFQAQEPPRAPDISPSSPTVPPQIVLFPEPPSMPLPPEMPLSDMGRISVLQPSDLSASSSTISPQIVLFPEPSSVPSEMPLPDLGQISGPQDKSRSVVKRALDRAKPNCLDAVVHTCWSSPPSDATTGMSIESREYLQDMELGTYYFKKKNYRGAMFRFRHALESKPGEPEATFRLAQSLDKLDQGENAKEAYQAYIESQPSGFYTEQARAALQRLSKPVDKN